mgnify:FL=1
MSRSFFSPETAACFQSAGFVEVRPSPRGLKAVRGHCEVHLSRDPTRGTWDLEIPVVRLSSRRPLSPEAASYLEDRNKSGKVRGAFAADGGFIWYRVCAESDASPASLARLAAEMQETVERLGPKILNLLK